MVDQVKYSICVANYNMSSTIMPALSSILDQLSGEFEVIVVDDGSTDGSIQCLRHLESQYPKLLNCIFLGRDRRRKLGETRNVACRAARGQFLILNIDADDVWEPYIKTFCKIYHLLNNKHDGKLCLIGNQISIIPRDNIEKYGPYRNTFVEDRDLWHRLIAKEPLIVLDHQPFRVRMVLPFKTRVRKVLVIKTWNHLLYEGRRTDFSYSYLWALLRNIVDRQNSFRPFFVDFLRLILLLPARFYGKYVLGTLTLPPEIPDHNCFVIVREASRRDLMDLLDPEESRCVIDEFSSREREIFKITEIRA